MDKIQDLPLTVFEQIVPTLSAFHVLLEKNKANITDIPQQSFQYGETERHTLDVYYPQSAVADGGKAPVLFFFYGGGFTTGSRNFAPPFELIYSSVGAFFAHQGFITIVPDYRLAPEFQYPKAAEDVLGAIKWAVSHPSNLIFGSSPNPDLDSLFLSGHSAGAAHATTLLFHETLIPVDSDLWKRIKGGVLMSGPYHFLPGGEEKPLAEAHWGSEANAAENSPIPLLLAWFAKNPRKPLPKILITQAENEPRWIYNRGIEFQRLLEWHSGERVEYVEGKGHNHISLMSCLSSGEGHEWGLKASTWIWNVVRNKEAEPIANAKAYIPDDGKETDEHECRKCQGHKTHAFEITLNNQAIQSKTFATCCTCGNKWSW